MLLARIRAEAVMMVFMAVSPVDGCLCCTPVWCVLAIEDPQHCQVISRDSKIIPIEVKSGKRTQAKSLKSYIERYNPEKTVKLVGKLGGMDKNNIVLPLYYVSKLHQIL